MRLFLLCPVVMVTALVGCSEPKPDGLPKLHSLVLKFTQEGSPCVGAAVRLVPQDGNPWVSGGTTDASGNAVFVTHGKYAGVPVGKYKITVSKDEVESDEMLRSSFYSSVDLVYTVESTTPLEIEVVAGKNVPQTFDLGKQVRVLKPGPPI